MYTRERNETPTPNKTRNTRIRTPHLSCHSTFNCPVTKRGDCYSVTWHSECILLPCTCRVKPGLLLCPSGGRVTRVRFVLHGGGNTDRHLPLPLSHSPTRWCDRKNLQENLVVGGYAGGAKHTTQDLCYQPFHDVSPHRHARNDLHFTLILIDCMENVTHFQLNISCVFLYLSSKPHRGWILYRYDYATRT